MDLETLKLFVEVVEQGSLTRASISTDALTSSLSRKISALEKECGGRLLHRTGRGVTLTELGEHVLPRVKDLLQNFEGLTKDLDAYAGVPRGQVRLGLIPSLAQPVVTRLFLQLRAKYPGIQLRVFGGSNGKLEEWLADGFVDAALLYRYGKPDATYEHALGLVDTYLISGAGDRRTQAATVPFAALHKLPLVLPAAPNGLRVILDQIARKLKIELNVVMETNSLTVHEDIVAKCDTYTVVAGHSAAHAKAVGLQASRIVEPEIERHVSLAVSARPASVAAREVARMLRQIVEDIAEEIGMRPLGVTRS